MGWKESQPNTSSTRLMGITRLKDPCKNYPKASTTQLLTLCC